MTLHSLGLAKRRLFRQVRACALAGSAGSEAHLAAIKSFHAAAWECFAARKVDPPETRTEYVFVVRQGDHRAFRPSKRKDSPQIDARTRKAILALERDCAFCWTELHRAIDNWPDGSRKKIQAIDAVNRWSKSYDKNWDAWLARGNRKLPAKLRSLQEFAQAHGQVHFVAGEEKRFGTAKEAQRYMRSSERAIEAAQAAAWYNSDTCQRLMGLFDRAVADHDEAIWHELEQALKQVEAEDREQYAERNS